MTKEPQQQTLPRERITARLNELLQVMRISGTIEEGVVGDTTTFNIQINEAGLLIGEDGRRLAALNHLLWRMIERECPDTSRFLIDVNHYHRRHFEELRDQARMGAQRVRYFKKPITLEPMPPFERRIVHLVLQEYPDILTESTGVGDKRRIVIKPN